MSESIDLSKYAKETCLRVEFVDGEKGIVVCHVECHGEHRAVADNGRTWLLNNFGSMAGVFFKSTSDHDISKIICVCEIIPSSAQNGPCIDLSGYPDGMFVRVRAGDRGNATVVIGRGDAMPGNETGKHELVHDDGGAKEVDDSGKHKWLSHDDDVSRIIGDVIFSDEKIAKDPQIDLSVYPRGLQFQVECDGGAVGCVHISPVGSDDLYPNLLIVDGVGVFWANEIGETIGEDEPSITRIIGQMEVISNEGEDEVDETFDVESEFVKGDPITAHWANSVNESIQKLQQQANSSGELFIIATNLIDALSKQNEQLTAMLNLQLHRSK